MSERKGIFESGDNGLEAAMLVAVNETGHYKGLAWSAWLDAEVDRLGADNVADLLYSISNPLPQGFHVWAGRLIYHGADVEFDGAWRRASPREIRRFNRGE